VFDMNQLSALRQVRNDVRNDVRRGDDVRSLVANKLVSTTC
jgi:hypothetical protein